MTVSCILFHQKNPIPWNRIDWRTSLIVTCQSCSPPPWPFTFILFFNHWNFCWITIALLPFSFPHILPYPVYNLMWSDSSFSHCFYDRFLVFFLKIITPSSTTLILTHLHPHVRMQICIRRRRVDVRAAPGQTKQKKKRQKTIDTRWKFFKENQVWNECENEFIVLVMTWKNKRKKSWKAMPWNFKYTVVLRKLNWIFWRLLSLFNERQVAAHSNVIQWSPDGVANCRSEVNIIIVRLSAKEVTLISWTGGKQDCVINFSFCHGSHQNTESTLINTGTVLEPIDSLSLAFSSW